jgi:ATP-dependent RNA helicase DeaD
MAVSFVTGREIRKLKEIENFIKLKIERRNIPTLKYVENSRNRIFLASIKDTIETGSLDKYINMVSEDLSEYSSVEVAAALMSIILEKKGGDGDSLSGVPGDELVRFFITLGRRDEIGIKDLVDWIREHTGLRVQDLMDIALMEKFSFVSVPSGNSSVFLEAIQGASFKGRKVHVELANKR